MIQFNRVSHFICIDMDAELVADGYRFRPWIRRVGWCEHIVPEIVAMFFGCFVTAGPPDLVLIALLSVLMRALLLGSIVLHESAHALIAGRFVDNWPLLQARALPAFSVLPLQAIHLPGLSNTATMPRVDIVGLDPLRRRWAGLAGPAANAALVLVSLPMLLTSPSLTLHWFSTAVELDLFVWGSLCLINLWMLATCWSDYAVLLGAPADALYCGNFGILAKRNPHERGFFPRRFRALTEQLGRETDIRGQQAGGLAIMGAGGRFVGHKIVNDKRGDLTRDLLASFGRRVLLRRLSGAKPMPSLFHLVAHYRYGTSSGPSVLETHWHRWCRPRRVAIWSVAGRELVRSRRMVENLITHNGDFDAWNAPWGRIEQATLGDWLAAVMGESNRAKGDSPKIAGMLDLLHTQGCWAACIRLAYAMQAGEALPAWGLKELTRVFEQVFERWVRAASLPGEDQANAASEHLSIVGCTSLAELAARNRPLLQTLVDDLWQASLSVMRTWPSAVKRRGRQIVGQAVHAFFYNDLYRAAQLFMAGAEGTFGLVMTSSLQPGAVALAADRQPMFIAADPHAGLLAYASEAAALTAALGENSEVASKETRAPAVYRFDLQDGDVALLQVREGTADNSLTLMNRQTGNAPVPQEITLERLAASARTDQQQGWIALGNNPYLRPTLWSSSVDHYKDRVLAEMTSIPIVLDRVQCEWDYPASLNRRTAHAFNGFFLSSARRWMEQQRVHSDAWLNSTLDLLVLGVENSLYVGQRFCEDLQRLLPYVHVRAVDAVAYCEDPGRFALGPETITLALSHSGQTFNTLDAVKFIQALHERSKAGPVFVMTGAIDSLMGVAVGQRINMHAPWGERVFWTCGGWRTAEPATVSSAAMHASLTQLLLRLAQDLRAQTGSIPAAGAGTEMRPFGLAATDDDLAKLDSLARLSVSRAEAMLGVTAEGWQTETHERAGLLRQGHAIARLITEPALAFIATALHLFIMLWLGWNPVIGIQELAHSATGWAAFDAATSVGLFLRVLFKTAYFLFAGVAFMLILRWLQQRPLWDRVFVGRALVIGDEPYVKDLLSQYVSKLFSLAYEFAGFAGIHAANTRSGEMLHTYGHRITRGLLFYLGMPDGRWPDRERAEAAICMTSNQARGVQSMGTGALVFGIGHNPASACKVDRFIQLGLCARDAEALPWVLRGDWSDLALALQESRFASFERLLGSYVVFHSAAAATRDLMNRLVPLASLLWTPVFFSVKLLTGGHVRVRFGYWDLSRTQSGTRIATTAAPVPATILDPDDYLTPAERHAAETLPSVVCFDSRVAVPEPLAAPVVALCAPRTTGTDKRLLRVAS